MRRLFAPLSLGMALLAVLGTAFPSHAGSTAVATNNHPLEPTGWSFQCFQGSICGTTGYWIPTVSQPGTTRLWDAGTDWYNLEPAHGTYDWTTLDTWLDLIAAHQPTAAIYTFGHTPCFLASTACGSNPWSPSPPLDLTGNGSPTFTAFVTALVEHCSPAGHCARDYIKYWEMWNEANSTPYWSGTVTQLYQMFKPVIPIIRNNVPGAQVLTPPVAGGNAKWMASWMALENADGRLSDMYSFHLYLWDQEPEQRMPTIERMVNTKNSNGWTTTPWLLSETNYDVNTYACSPIYSVEDCQGQLVRWHVLLYAYQGGQGGAYNVGWFDWPSIISGGYDTFYYTMMQWLTGATFTASCTTSGTVYTCPLTEANGASALIVWNTAGASTYTPAKQYVDYREFNGTYGGATVPISAGEATTIGLIPVMFEAK